jgi:hypothetical protein
MLPAWAFAIIPPATMIPMSLAVMLLATLLMTFIVAAFPWASFPRAFSSFMPVFVSFVSFRTAEHAMQLTSCWAVLP